MKILFTILFSFLISIYSIGCDSSNSSTNSSDCPFLNQSRGCDGVCSINPLTYDACGVCGGSAVLSGCDNTCGSTLENDACGVCGGDGSTCEGNWNVFYDGSVPISGFNLI